MRAACVTADIEAMIGAMDAMTERDWEAMGRHMGGAMSSHMAVVIWAVR